MTTFEQSIVVTVAAAIFCFVGGLITKNYSHVDRLWSILPPIYVIIWWQDVPIANLRFILGASMVILWGIRLTANFARRGGYKFDFKRGFYEEDYRWAILRKNINNRFLFEIFNLVFISLFQITLIFGFTLPLYFVSQSSAPFELVDGILIGLHILFLSLETIADQQQWNYHCKKKNEKFKEDPRYALGFNTFGLWNKARHPNYFFEILQWVVIWTYAIRATSSCHPSGIAVAILILLFLGSTKFAEQVTAEKYDKYQYWKQLTTSWIPIPIFKNKQRRKFLEELK